MNNRKRRIEKIPAWAISAIINDDYSGLDDVDEKMVREWCDESEYDIICAPNGEPYFTNQPAFGLPCKVYNCTCFYL